MELKIEGIDYSKILAPWIGKTFKMMENYAINLLKESDIEITKQQWLVLNLIHTKGTLSQKSLASFINRDKTSVTRFISNLEKNGFIEKKISRQDKRMTELITTKKGIEVMKKTTPIIKEFAKTIQEDLEKEEIQKVMKILKKIQLKLKEI